MLISSWLIAGYGLLLVIGDMADASLGLGMEFGGVAGVPCWAIGLLVIAAGVASNQGRRSLRLTGFYVGILIPLGLVALCLWRVLPMLWSSQYRLAAGPSLLGVLSLAAVAAIIQLRPQPGIATRGYVVPLATRRPPSTESASTVRRSEAG